ncbi:MULTISPECIES: hypothetical protein [unclassified Peribacillus]|uniref:hypothetical protein n=1 Tax=unclassified Peribacillus TaxID=2675266 RepID=UPI00366BC43A
MGKNANKKVDRSSKLIWFESNYIGCRSNYSYLGRIILAVGRIIPGWVELFWLSVELFQAGSNYIGCRSNYSVPARKSLSEIK